jgi:hypothetical protein
MVSCLAAKQATRLPGLIAVMVDRVLQRTPLGRGHEFKLLAAGRAVRPPDLQGCCRSVEAGIGHHVNAVVELALCEYPAITPFKPIAPLSQRRFSRRPFGFVSLMASVDGEPLAGGGTSVLT